MLQEDETMTANPLLALSQAHADLPDFAAIRPEHVVPAVEQAIAEHVEAMKACALRAGDPALLAGKDAADVALGRVWGVVSHLLMVANTPDLRAAHAQAQPLIDAHYSAVGQDRALYEALAAIDPAVLGDGERRALGLALRSSSCRVWRWKGRRARILPPTASSRAVEHRIFQCGDGCDRGMDLAHHR
jgi:oligopeptidase A